MKTVNLFVKRNVKLFFKDKGMFFTALITPVILLVLYVTFLGNVYRESFLAGLPGSVQIPDNVINGFIGGQLFSSLLAVSCVTVSFCSNMLMVQDKISGAWVDFGISTVNKKKLAISYYLATTLSTLIICFVAMGACFIYLAIVGWHLSITDVLLLLLDVFILVMFGTALSSIVNRFLKTQGQISAVGSIVSSCYGFISGAYMPIWSFGEGLRNVIMFLPGTYGTSLLRNHALNGVLQTLGESIPVEALQGIKDSVDCNLYLFGSQVSIGTMYLIIGLTTLALIGIYVFITAFSGKKRIKDKKINHKG